MTPTSLRCRLGTIAFSERTAAAHAVWLERGPLLLTDGEQVELGRVRVVDVELVGLTDAELDQLEALLMTMGGEINSPFHRLLKNGRRR